MTTTAADQAGLEEMIAGYCECWGERDAERRRRILERVWAPDATYTDPTVHAVGIDELLAHLDKVIAKRAGAWIARTSSIDLHHGLFRFNWHMVLADGRTTAGGADFGEVAPDGKLQRIIGFFGALEHYMGPPRAT